MLTQATAVNPQIRCYGGQVSAQQQVVDAGKRAFFTECSGTDSADTFRTFADSLRRQAENHVVQNFRHGGETVLTQVVNRHNGTRNGVPSPPAPRAGTASSPGTVPSA